MGFIKLYTRTPKGEEYPSATAYSIHMAISDDGAEYEPLNQNYGMLYPEAYVDENNVIQEKGVKYPVAFARTSGGYGFAGVVVNPDGTKWDKSEGKVWYFTSDDLVHFKDRGLVDISEIEKDGCTAAIGACEESIMEVCDKDLEAMKAIWIPIYNTAVESCENAVVSSKEELDKIKVKAVYSDGSIHMKNVLWDDSGVDYNTPGKYSVTGVIKQPVYRFPLAEGYADPIVFFYEGKWYFIATNDNTDDVGLFVRGADNIEDLFAEDVKEYCILEYDEDRNLIQTFWAPEFHMIGGELYILFAVGPKNWGPHSHMMKLKKGGNILNAEDWEDPVMVKRADGSPIEKGGITLDMTYVKVKDRSYLVWSERYHIGTGLDSGSMIYIASVDESNPYVITSEPMLLTRPLYGWENQYGTINNEGPYPLIIGDKVYIAYSGGSAGGYSYVVGLMSADCSADLLDINSWDKALCPLLSAYSVAGEYGPGHNGFYRDENDDIWITYHAKTTPGWAVRCTAIRRVHLNVYGEPVFNMSAERDISPELKNVAMTVTVK